MKDLKINFGGLPEKFSSWKNSQFSVIPVPYEMTTSYMAGTRLGPRSILTASEYLELFDDELKIEPYREGIFTAPFVEPNLKTPQSTLRAIEKAVGKYVRRGRFPVLLGGEHTVTLGVLSPLMKRHGSFSLLQLDAHGDLRDRYQGTKYSHACVGRRIVEQGINLVQAGVRSLSEEEDSFIRRKNLRTYYAHELVNNPTEVTNAMVSNLTDPVYISVDIDFFDPGGMPSVGTPEPGGVGWYTGLQGISGVVRKKRVIGFDVVELSPIPGVVAPDFFAAKLVYRMMGYAVADASSS